MEDMEPIQQLTRPQLREAADRMLKEGIEPAEVAQFLSAQGLDISSIHAMIGSLTQGNAYFAATENNISEGEDISTIGNSQAGSSSANKDILYGGLWLLGGTVVTIWSLSNGKGGVIAWGAIIFGGYQFIRGLMNANRN